MITKAQALTTDVFHADGCSRRTGPRGGVMDRVVAYRRNGRTQTWTTRPDDFRVPVKRGLYVYDEITDWNATGFHVEIECPLNGKEVAE